tara:strand:- start:154 stop:501 length:348 start_codon:yes stop_codon:yes gene_type:complete
MKIISYSIFGEEQWYRNGLIKNIDIAKSLLRDWTVRVYISDKIEYESYKYAGDITIDYLVEFSKTRIFDKFNFTLIGTGSILEYGDVVKTRDFKVFSKVFKINKSLSLLKVTKNI